MLQVIGITKARWGWLTRQKSGCQPCNQRQEAANTLGHRFQVLVSSFLGWCRHNLFPVDRDLAGDLQTNLDAAPRQHGQDRNLDTTVDDD